LLVATASTLLLPSALLLSPARGVVVAAAAILVGVDASVPVTHDLHLLWPS